MTDVLVPVKEIAPLIKELLVNRSVKITVKGNSMFPLFKSMRDSVLIENVKPKRRDVVLFQRSDGTIILHRLVKHNKKGYYFLGDNQIRVEGPIEDDKILGVCTKFWRKGKEVSVSKSKKYKLYSFFWTVARPFRRVLFFFGKTYLKLKNGKENK